MNRLVALACSLAIIGSLGAPAAHVDAVSDPVAAEIPGTPLSAGSVSGAAGGTIVDQVYSFEIPEKAVLVISLSGEIGSELGLYLFDESSTSILSNTPVAQAAKPGGQQTLVRSFLEPARVYINVNGRNLDRPYAYSLQVTLLIDTSPPVFRELIVPATTKTAELCIYISASDPTSSVREVSVGEASNTPDWVSYVGPARYCTELAPGTTDRSILIAAKNGIGLIARRVVGVTTDDYAPELVGSTPAGEVLLTGQEAISWRFNEPIFSAVSSQPLVRIQSADGRLLSGTTRLSMNRRTIDWTPNRAIPAGSVVLASLSAITDAAGNTRPADLTRILTRKNATALQIRLISKSGTLARIELNISKNLIGKEIEIQGWDGSAWSTIRKISQSSVTARRRVSAGSMNKIRARFTGSERLQESQSRTVQLSK
jgi:hypothetical protein